MKEVITGHPERLYIEYTDANGALVDPLRPKITIFAPSGNEVVASADPSNEDVGIWYYLFSATTAYATERGLYQAWWEGYVNGGPVYMDEPVYFQVKDIPVISSSTSEGRYFTIEIRGAIGDNREDEYMILPQDLNYYIEAGFRNANAIYDLGYDVQLSTAGNDKSGRISFLKNGAATALGQTERAWYALTTVRDILEAQTRINMFGPGIVTQGDIKVNLSAGLRAQTAYLDHIKAQLKEMETELKLNGGVVGYWINTFEIDDLWVPSQ